MLKPGDSATGKRPTFHRRALVTIRCVTRSAWVPDAGALAGSRLFSSGTRVPSATCCSLCTIDASDLGFLEGCSKAEHPLQLGVFRETRRAGSFGSRLKGHMGMQSKGPVKWVEKPPTGRRESQRQRKESRQAVSALSVMLFAGH